MSERVFTGKAVLVTGAASGLGRATAIRFAEQGALLCIVDVNAGGLAETAKLVADAGSTSVIWSGDLGQPANCATAVDVAVKAYGRLDVLCNVAGILRFHALADVTPADWSQLLAVNLTAPFFMIQAAMPHLLKSEGNIVNVASTAAFVGQSYTAPYGATKAAIVSLTKSLAMEFMKSPVRINAVAPGGMMTPMALGAQFPEGADMDMITRYCGFRPPSDPQEIADLILFVASDRAKSVHGACYMADNGITAG